MVAAPVPVAVGSSLQRVVLQRVGASSRPARLAMSCARPADAAALLPTALAPPQYVGAYQMSFGPISWLLCGEVFPLKVRQACLIRHTSCQGAVNLHFMLWSYHPEHPPESQARRLHSMRSAADWSRTARGGWLTAALVTHSHQPCSRVCTAASVRALHPAVSAAACVGAHLFAISSCVAGAGHRPRHAHQLWLHST